jgi:hypothetical protein
MLQGYWVAQITAVLARLGIPDQLAHGPRRAHRVAEVIGAHPGAVLRLLRAAALLGLVREVDSARYELTELGDCLRTDAPASVRAYALGVVAPGHWGPWAELETAIRTGQPTAPAVLGAPVWEYYAAHPEEGGHFADAMGELSSMAAADVAAVADASGHEELVDVGGAYGVLLTGLLERNPTARGVLFDRPDVLDAARRKLGRSSLAERIDLVAGDFLEEVPEGDLYLLKQILHDWDDDDATTILGNCRRAAREGSSLLVVEMIVPEPWAPSPVHLLDLTMLVMLGGRERTLAEYDGLLGAAGWKRARVVPTSGPFSVIEAVVA